MDREDLALHMVALNLHLLRRHPEILLSESDYEEWKLQHPDYYRQEHRLLQDLRHMAPTMAEHLNTLYYKDTIKAPTIVRKPQESKPLAKDSCDVPF